MSQWGNRDNIPLQSTVTVVSGSKTVVSAGTDFSGNVDAGDTIFLNNVAYKVEKVLSANTLVLDVNYENANATLSGSYIQQSPKDITTYGWGNVTTGANTVNARNVYGVDRLEINVAENKDKGINHTGWVHHRSYTNTQGSLRNRSEVLVAMSKNFNANATGVLSTDANDDVVVPDLSLVFSVQPTNQSALAGNSVVFTSTAASIPAGASISYQWFESTDGTEYAVVNDGGDYSGNTTNTLTISEVANVDGNLYRVVISATGATSVTSSSATATEL